jgi:hypothetical protein
MCGLRVFNAVMIQLARLHLSLLLPPPHVDFLSSFDISTERYTSSLPKLLTAHQNTYPAHLQSLMDALRSKYPESSADRYE